MISIGGNRECFFDDYLLDTERTTAEFRVHHPIRKSAVLTHEEPWEGPSCDFHNFFYDEEYGFWRMYYNGFGFKPQVDICYAESKDGIHWEKPKLGICVFEGSTENNIILSHRSEFENCRFGLDNFFVFKDENPACKPDEKYKGVLGHCITPGELFIFTSQDGIHFKETYQIPTPGQFDSVNVMFWDPEFKKYRCYYRWNHDIGSQTNDGPSDTTCNVRDVRYIESEDFINWTEQKRLVYKDNKDLPMYTNMVMKYPRSDSMYIAFPTRYIERQEWDDSFEELCGKKARKKRMQSNKRFGLAITDCLFMCSRDGVHFTRYHEAFFRPGVENPINWVYGDCYPARGIIVMDSEIQGADPEFNMFTVDHKASGAQMYRYTIRQDGFVSLHAGGDEKLLVTKPFIFEGSVMRINFSTSAWGNIKFKITDEDGNSIESCETFGDKIDRKVAFDGDLSAFSGKSVVLEAVLIDADLYALQFTQA